MLAASLASSLATLALLAAPLPEPGTVLQYRGTFVAQKGEVADSKKSLELAWLVLSADGATNSLAWTLAEEGKGAWAWPDRFGKLEFGESGPTGGQAPAFLYERSDGKSVVGLTPPLVPVDIAKLQKDSTWQQDKLDYVVTGQQSTGGRPTWRIEGRNAYGVRRVLIVETQRPVVRSYRERVFIGQGQEFELLMELVDESQLAEPELAKASEAIQSLADLRERLAYPGRAPRLEWNEKQLETLKATAPKLAGLGQVALLAGVARAFEQDVKTQRGRAGAVASLREKVIGQEVAKWSLAAIRGEALDSAKLAGKVTVLHFWEYRDAPLEEPYGQIGFLDFLYRKRNQDGKVQVIGVAVDDQAGDPDVRRRVGQAAGRLKTFMNLSYPVYVDDGTVLKSFGDPRVAGGKLPLFVVIGPDGKVVEYHAGLFEVHRDRGLEELDKTITKALETRE